MIKKINKNVIELSFKNFGSCIYLVNINKKIILIDTGSLLTRSELKEDLENLKINPEKIDIVILTHNHWDHTGNNKLFSNAKFYGNKKDFKKEKILDIDNLNIKEFKIIQTPGHTKGSFCILYKDILFSGDTIFHKGYIGRTDLPGGDPDEIQKSLKKLSKIKYKTLCPGHLL
ncbi:MBL fold metallo-hydrolase [Candidatus Pacearchaeota archaeon]|nr:MBL fold metallo-hydrolase [Candidatus Pacearchaeota archaeon]